MSDDVNISSTIPLLPIRPRPPRPLPAAQPAPADVGAKAAEAQPNKDYAVGYGRPPVATRFKKGTSGNSKGRPKGARGYRTMVEAALNKKVDVSIDGKNKKLSQVEVTLMQLLKKATRGDLKSINHTLQLAKEHDRWTEERASVKDVPSELAPLSDSDREMMAHCVHSDLIDQRFTPEDAQAAMRVFGFYGDQPVDDKNIVAEASDGRASKN